jgi:putative copper resistance protein D
MALLALSFAASLLIRRTKLLWIAQAALAAGATASFVWTGHGAMNAGAAGVVHVIADLLHLLAAGIWIGALLPLAVLVSRSMRSRQAEDENATLLGLNRFSAIGIWVVAVLVLSGIANSWFLIGPRWRALFTSGYGVALLVKLGLFGLMMVLAALNRYRTTAALRNTLAMRAAARPALGSLKLTILSETGLAFLVLLAVSVLGTLAPPVSGE